VAIQNRNQNSVLNLCLQVIYRVSIVPKAEALAAEANGFGPSAG